MAMNKSLTCRVCNQSLSPNFFYVDTAKKSGRSSYCKPCDKAKALERYQKNRAKRLAQAKEWAQNNREKADAHSQAWKLRNPEKRKATASAYARNNRPRMNAYWAAREALKRKATPQWADMAKIAEFYVTSDALSMHTGTWYNVDHIVPLQSPIVCGLHNQFNLQVLSRLENYRKGNRYWPDMP
jgi:hypothetical protein